MIASNSNHCTRELQNSRVTRADASKDRDHFSESCYFSLDDNGNPALYQATKDTRRTSRLMSKWLCLSVHFGSIMSRGCRQLLRPPLLSWKPLGGGAQNHHGMERSVPQIPLKIGRKDHKWADDIETFVLLGQCIDMG